MKKVFWLFLMAAVASPVFGAEPSESERLLLEGRKLIVSKVVAEYPGVPKGISAENAYKLINGEIPNLTVKAVKGKIKRSFSWPLKSMTAYSDKVVSYVGGEWIERESLRQESDDDWLLIIFGLVLPGLGILAVSLENQLMALGSRKLAIFYLAMLAGVLAAGGIAGMLGGVVTDESSSLLVGVLFGGLAGGIAGILGGGITDESRSFLVGVLFGVLTGGLTGGLAVEQGDWIVIQYFVFLIAIEAVSFVTARIARLFSERYPRAS